eukprot:TRINITY_DN4204_c0_g1_i1.p1 TRINITY_DN4204_c0_g1~~TRINITY_DN4204_c0_g1_i1.p1  ORF type:complete len:106 (-),score=8.37 TRINITY_DN4204_c0_g1_i1:60-377(-)
MTKAHVNRLDNESLSALLDGEQALNDAEIASADVATFGRYALIGDAMRAKETQNMGFDISDRISLALDSEPVYADFSQSESVAKPVSTEVDNKSWRLIGASRLRS